MSVTLNSPWNPGSIPIGSPLPPFEGATGPTSTLGVDRPFYAMEHTMLKTILAQAFNLSLEIVSKKPSTISDTDERLLTGGFGQLAARGQYTAMEAQSEAIRSVRPVDRAENLLDMIAGRGKWTSHSTTWVDGPDADETGLSLNPAELGIIVVALEDHHKRYAEYRAGLVLDEKGKLRAELVDAREAAANAGHAYIDELDELVDEAVENGVFTGPEVANIRRLSKEARAAVTAGARI